MSSTRGWCPDWLGRKAWRERQRRSSGGAA
jgi:hypothetical protein